MPLWSAKTWSINVKERSTRLSRTIRPIKLEDNNLVAPDIRIRQKRTLVIVKPIVSDVGKCINSKCFLYMTERDESSTESNS